MITEEARLVRKCELAKLSFPTLTFSARRVASLLVHSHLQKNLIDNLLLHPADGVGELTDARVLFHVGNGVFLLLQEECSAMSKANREKGWDEGWELLRWLRMTASCTEVRIWVFFVTRGSFASSSLRSSLCLTCS